MPAADLAMTATWANATSLGDDSGVFVRIWSLRRQRYRAPTIATTPNTRIAAPEIRFTQVRAAMVTFDRSTATTAVRTIHHDVEPRKTPRTSRVASAPPVPVRPRPANRPAKDRIVIGFVIVSPKIDPNAPTSPGRSATT